MQVEVMPPDAACHAILWPTLDDGDNGNEEETDELKATFDLSSSM